MNAQTIRKLRDGDFDESALLRLRRFLAWMGAPLARLRAANGVQRKSNRWRGSRNSPPITTAWPLTHILFGTRRRAWQQLSILEPIAKRCCAAAKRHKLDVQLILLTHAHPDHVADLPALREETGADVFTPAREPVPGAEPIDEGKKFRLGNLQIDTRLTWGHSPGGMTYVVTGLARPIAIVGDSLFAGSMGGGNVSYRDALQNNLEKILTLPDETIICPGHGPMTTVAEEKQHNPFFAAKFDGSEVR